MDNQSKSNYYLLLSIVFGGFLIFGLSENIKGPAIPRIQTDFSLGEAKLGLLLALNALGYLCACFFTSALAAKIGVKATAIIAFVSMPAAGFLIYISANFAFLSASYFLLYVGNGMLEIGLAIIAANIFTRNTGTMMNLSHFFYGLGSTFAPIFAASVMGWNVMGGELGWRGMYLFILAFSLLPVLPALIGKFPKEDEGEEGRVSYARLASDPIAWFIVIILTSGVIAELGIASWLVNYLVKVYDWSLKDASKMLSVFFLFFMLARLLLGPLIDKIGYAFSLIALSAFAGIISMVAIFAGEQGALLFAIAGVGIAPIYPTVMAVIARRYPKGTSKAITFVAVLMGIGSVIGNFLIGYVIELVGHLAAAPPRESMIIGLQAGYGFIAAAALLCSGCSIVMYLALQKNKEII